MANYPYKRPGTQLDVFRESIIEFQIGVEQDLRNTQGQISKLVAEGDSSPQAAAAAVDIYGYEHDTLKDRLDEGQKQVVDINERVSEKADKDEVYLKQKGININDFDEATRRTFLQQQGIDVNYILGVGNVKPENAAFFRRTRNLFNKSTTTLNKHVDAWSGKIIDNLNAQASDFIPVKANQRYTLNYPQQIAWFDKDKKYISGISMGNVFTALSPGNAAYVRITVMNENIDSVQFEEGLYKTDYVNYGFEFDEENYFNAKPILSVIYDKPSKNLFNKANVIKGRQINYTAGTTSSNAETFYAFKIKVEPNQDYTLNVASFALAFYNANDEYISGLQNQRTFTTPGSVEYLQFSTALSNLDTTQLEKGRESTPYSEYGNKISAENIDGTFPGDGETDPTTPTPTPGAAINKYPFQEKAAGDSRVFEAIKEIKLYGTNKNLKYRVRAFRRNSFSSTDNVSYWVIEIADSNNLIVASWTKSNYTEPAMLDKIYLDQRNGSGVSGIVWIDWAKLGTSPLNLLSQTYESMGLDENVYMYQDEARAYTGNLHNINGYYWDAILESVTKIRNLKTPNTLTFTEMADSHIEKVSIPTKSSIEAISALAEYADVDFIAHLGDLIVGDLVKEESLRLCDLTMALSKKYAKCPVFAIRGNHDRNDLYPFSSDEDRKANLITNKNWYQSVTSRSEQYGIVGDPDTPFSNYYYKDFDKQKIRAVFLDTCEMIETDGVPNLPKYAHSSVASYNQLKWLADKALKFTDKEDPNGWAIIAFSHIPTVVEEKNHNYGVVSSEFMSLINAFKEGTNGSITAESQTINYEFAEGNEFIGHFHGHVHEDIHIQKDGINYFISNSTMPSKRWGTSLEREAYGPKTLSANTMVIDRETRTVNIIKTGIGSDYTFTW